MTEQTATERDQAEDRVHCAPADAARGENSAAAPGSASERAPAREGSAPSVHWPPESAQFSAESAPDSAVTDGDETGGRDDRQDDRKTAAGWRERLAAARELVVPPDIWSQDRPALQRVWAYACRGEWTTAEGLARRAGQAYVWFTIAATAVLYAAAWVLERPARLAVAVVLVAVLAQFPPVSWLI